MVKTAIFSLRVKNTAPSHPATVVLKVQSLDGHIGITWELAKNAKAQAHPKPTNQELRAWRPVTCVLTVLQVDGCTPDSENHCTTKLMV